MDLPGKRRPPEEDDDLEAEAIKRQRISDGEEDEEGGGEEGTDGAALPGLAVYKDDDDEEEEGAGRREHWMGQEIGRGETIENGGGQVRVSAEDAEVMEEFHQKDASRPPAPVRQQRQVERRRDCPYLDTVNRQVLDFDFESLEAGHHVYINLQTEKVYCLPDGYEIDDPSLDDIRHVLNPRFSREQVLHLDENRQWSRALDGSNYLPGMVGLNNIKETDFVNVTIQSLMRVTPLRNFFLIPENYQHSKSPLVHRFGELTRKIWHARNFKGQVSPHEFLQAVMKASNKRFQIGVQSDPVEFMSWLLNTLHAQLRHSKKKDRSIIYDCFQGELEVMKEIQKKPLIEKNDHDDEGNKVIVAEGGSSNDSLVRETSKVPFLMLGLDLPPPPLFKDAMEKNIIPQVPLFNILKKFDGETVTEVVRPCIARMRYRVTRLPKYLILHMRRFTKNNFFIEKNPTLVNFPVKNLELKDYIPLPPPKVKKKLRSKYDLIANIVHDGKPGEGCYRVFVQRKSEELWYEMQDLHVTETLPQMVALSEAYMQIYEQQE
ncbi:hypothetical protein OPV22_028606 [Ensete ventricosum]|uniref:USP domain-containing protein n=1 Tax=Ensete ventricosum TaxID=4639 RepID=A0AAV8Q471_ENSVE|nr:hypothetical protein OPV22_028606 [Ensete ventricosum]